MMERLGDTSFTILWTIAIVAVAALLGIIVARGFDAATENNKLRVQKIEACKQLTPDAAALCIKTS